VAGQSDPECILYVEDVNARSIRLAFSFVLTTWLCRQLDGRAPSSIEALPGDVRQKPFAPKIEACSDGGITLLPGLMRSARARRAILHDGPLYAQGLGAGGEAGCR